jgi:multiple sugar transport system ATP-binding protein
MATVELRKVGKKFGKVAAVRDFSLDIRDGEFIVFVGPSGCGKTTTLRMVAGLETITEGEVYINDRLVNNLPSKERNVAMVFQNYALYPHLTVYENMAFGLKLKKTPRAEIEQRVQKTAELLGIDEFLKRKPKALSGGQRQRVAVGRAIVRTPQVFLFDEPLSNLDAKLRIQMRLELKKLHERLAITSIYVTHDQIEAMTMGDRIVVMKDGLIHQVGTPMELYHRPANLFVASFIGSPTMNFISVRVARDQAGEMTLEAGAFRLSVPPEKQTCLLPYLDQEVILGIRPDDFSQAGAPQERRTIEATVAVVQPVGSQIYLDVKAGEHDLIAAVDSACAARAHQGICLQVNLDNLHLFDAQTEKAIRGNDSPA